MSSTDRFMPRWASPPGDTIRDALAERSLSVEQFADAIGVPIPRVESLLDGDAPISIDLAQRIGSVLGGTVQFWISRDGQYRDDLSRIAADEWAKTLPTAQMVALGWIDKPSTWQDRIAKSLDFFGVPNAESWERAYGALVETAKFRFAAAGRMDAPAVAAWLRKAEIQATGIDSGPWDREAFGTVLTDVRRLSLMRDPAEFTPQLVAACASAGVSLVVVRAPRGCPATGAARFLNARNALIVLSARYLTDDHFWFSFFHEAAHLLLHDSSATYVDEFQQAVGDPVSIEEKEADAFAGDMLLPADVRAQLGKVRPLPRDIVRLARAAQVSPGIVVGQLQHSGTIGFATKFNGFKRHYRWNGPTLEKA